RDHRPRPTELPGRGRDARARVLPRRRRSRGEAGVGGVPGPATGRSVRGGLSRHVGAQRHGRGGGWGRRAGALHRSARPSHPSCGEGQGRQEEEAVRRLVVAGLVLACACSRSAADHEELGDRAYAAGEFRNALAEYQLGLKAHPGSADLCAKAGAAALHTGEYALAGAQYVALGQTDRSRAAEAADGLERVVRAALAANERNAAASALQGLRTVSPSRPLGKYTLLGAGKPADAEDWFRRASAPGSPPDVVRGAFLGLGDVKLAQGDIPDALEHYQQALTGGTPGDTIAQRAHEKINAVGKADAPSTTPS